MSEARCPECSDQPEMVRLGIGGSGRYYLCTACGLIRLDQYTGAGISSQTWHTDINALPSEAARTEASHLLAFFRAKQLKLF